jgi:hypothetical protein
MPKRPPWNFKETPEEIQTREKIYFNSWLNNVYKTYPKERLNYFEHNLEVSFNFDFYTIALFAFNFV